MPTLILLDTSLSMSRLTEDGETTLKDLAVVGVNTFLDHLSQHNPLEFVALATFSSTFNLLTSFTRDHHDIRICLPSLIEEDRTCMKGALAGACSAIHLEWGLLLPAQILMITDGLEGVEDGSNDEREDENLLRNSTCSVILMNLPLNPPNPYTFSNHSINPHLTRKSSSTIMTLLQTYFPSRYKIYTPELALSSASVATTFTCVSKTHTSPSRFSLRAGHHHCKVNVFPPVLPPEKQVIWDEIVVCGSLHVSDLSNPPFYSRHLVLPVSDPSDDKDSSDKQATFTVLLHGSLKVEGMVTLVQLCPDWFGVLYVQPDSKKKSNLNLSLFKYGHNSVPWLGSFNDLAPAAVTDTATDLSSTCQDKPPFPITTYPDKKSYSQNCVVWIHNVGLQGDIQKIIRNGRKIPEKQTQFYKELNRVRKAALSIGFFELFAPLASLLEREARSLNPSAHPSCRLQLTHAAGVLRSSKALDANQHIHPLPIN